jgi:hypothetical protein
MSTVQSTPTAELERLASAYTLAGAFRHLNEFERSAVLSGIHAELASRGFALENHFQFADEAELRGILADALKVVMAEAKEKEQETLVLEGEVMLLEDQLAGPKGGSGEQKGES